jgi:hypothetical protein
MIDLEACGCMSVWVFEDGNDCLEGREEKEKERREREREVNDQNENGEKQEI